jgi:hypothetical protein
MHIAYKAVVEVTIPGVEKHFMQKSYRIQNVVK